MKHRQWMGKQQSLIMVEGPDGKTSLVELRVHHQISQAQCYLWRDELFPHGGKVSDRGGPEHTEPLLIEGNRPLKTIVGRLTAEQLRVTLDRSHHPLQHRLPALGINSRTLARVGASPKPQPSIPSRLNSAA